jgi:hypothetical protein
MHVIHVCVLEHLLQFRIAICSVESLFGQARAILPKHFESQRPAAVLLRQVTVTCKRSARLGMYVNRTGARRHTLPMERVVGKQD